MFVQVSFADRQTEKEADQNRFRIVSAPNDDGVKLLRNFIQSNDDTIKRFAAFAIANLTMYGRL